LDLKPFFGVNIYKKYIALKNSTPIKLSIWDVDMNKEDHDYKTDYMRGSMGAIIITDSSDRSFFSAIKNMLKELKKNAGNIPFMVIDKNDSADFKLTSEVNQKILEIWVEKHGGYYVRGKYLNKQILNRTFNHLSEIIYTQNRSYFDNITVEN
jgi:GTPase SAR1 family protein